MEDGLGLGGEADLALARDLARDVVGQVAPEELPLFEAISDAQLGRRRPRLPRGAADRVLGFGLEDGIQLLTPAILATTLEVVKHVAGDLGASGFEAVRLRLARAIRRRPPPPAQTPGSGLPGLSDADLAELRSLVLRRSKELKVPAAKAELLADAVVGRIAVSREE